MYKQKIMENIKKEEESFTGKATRINVLYTNPKQLNNLKNSEEFKSFIRSSVLEHIEYAIKNNLEKIVIFDIFNISILIEIEQKYFNQILKKFIKDYTLLEDYEKCKSINKLINS